MSTYKKFTCNGTLRQVFICQGPTLPLTHCIRVQYTYSHREGGGDEDELNQSLQSWIENTYMTDCISGL